MPTPVLNSSYTTYEISEKEFVECQYLTPSQRAKLQNDRIAIIEQKLALTPNSMSAADKESYWQQEAYLRGQLDILTTLLAASDAAERIMASNVTDADTSVFNSFPPGANSAI